MNEAVQKPHSETEDAVAEAKALLQAGRLEDAAASAGSVLETDPDNVEALYILAVCQRYLKRLDDARETLNRLKTVSPSYGRAYQEEGHAKRLQADFDGAIAAYEQAVSLNPALIASWKALAELQLKRGHHEAAAAKQEADRLGALPPELVSVTSFIHEGRILKAELLCRSFLQKSPHHVEAMRLLADIGMRLYVLDDAEFLLESAKEFEPGNVRVHMDYVNVLHRRQKYAQARDEAHKLFEKERQNPAFATLYANECAAVGEFDEALGLYETVLKRVPDNAHVHLVHGHALKTVGRQDDAVSAYRAAYEKKPDLGDAFWSLANLKTYRFTGAEIEQMKKAEAAAGTTLLDRIHLCFALGKAFEDAQEYEDSFLYYARGNALKKEQNRYDPDRMDAQLAAQKDVCTPDLFKAHGTCGDPSHAPIFIVGLPRAGSTLLEQILASHSQVDGTLELPNILALVHRLSGRLSTGDESRYPKILSELPNEKLRGFGTAYIRDTQIHRKGAPRFTDKMPNNFRHIGLIHLILPHAKIIDARRHPLACCFSGFKQLFAEGQEFTYGLEDVGRYYRGYVDLMDHWDQVLPNKVLRVQYEDVVADLEGQVRRLLEFCELPFEQACVDYHKTERSVRTASSEQVRQPLYRDGVEQWRNFEPWLDPLKAALGPELLG